MKPSSPPTSITIKLPLLLLLLLLTTTTPPTNARTCSFPLWTPPLSTRRRHRRRTRHLRPSSSSTTTTSHNRTRRHLHKYTPRSTAIYQGYGTHYMDLWIGYPHPQRQTVVIDTGSARVAVACTGCVDCGEGNHTDEYFDYERSRTFRKLKCGDCLMGRCDDGGTNGEDSEERCAVSASYIEGSGWDAFEAMDRVYPGGWHHASPPEALLAEDEIMVVNNNTTPPAAVANLTFDLRFGCETSLTGVFSNQLENGIAGMMNSDVALWKQMHDAGHIDRQLFSLCYVTERIADRNRATVAGAMTMGGYETELHETPLVYAASDTARKGFYRVKVRRLYLWEADDWKPTVGNVTMESVTRVGDFATGAMDHVVDSGTTSTYLSMLMEAPFKLKWKDIVGVLPSETGFKLTDDQIGRIPTVLLQLVGDVGNRGLDPETTPGLAGVVDSKFPHDVIVAIPPRSYILYDESNDEFLSRIHFHGKMDAMIGANTMSGHDVVFDVENGRIGFAESDCEFSKVKEKEGGEER